MHNYVICWTNLGWRQIATLKDPLGPTKSSGHTNTGSQL